jgi:hypothetical protein
MPLPKIKAAYMFPCKKTSNVMDLSLSLADYVEITFYVRKVYKKKV